MNIWTYQNLVFCSWGAWVCCILSLKSCQINFKNQKIKTHTAVHNIYAYMPFGVSKFNRKCKNMRDRKSEHTHIVTIIIFYLKLPTHNQTKKQIWKNKLLSPCFKLDIIFFGGGGDRVPLVLMLAIDEDSDYRLKA